MFDKITVTYTRQSDLIVLCQNVLEYMEINKNDFPNPPQALATLKTVWPEFQAALANAQSRDRRLVAIKNKQLEVVLGLLQEVADFVTIVSKGDRAIALGSGFDIPGESRSNYEAPSINKLEVVVGLPGEATLKGREVAGAKAYLHQYTTEAPGLNTKWNSEGGSSANYTFRGLASEKRHWFRTVAIGTNGKLGYSPIVSRLVE